MLSTPDTKAICGVTIKDIAQERLEKPLTKTDEFTLKTEGLAVSTLFDFAIWMFQVADSGFRLLFGVFLLSYLLQFFFPSLFLKQYLVFGKFHLSEEVPKQYYRNDIEYAAQG